MSFHQNFEFSKSVELFKSYNFSRSMYKKKFKNDQDVCRLEHDYMEMKMIVRDQSKNYFHLTLKLAHCAHPPCPPTNVDYVFFYCTNFGIYHEMRGKHEWWT